jgi:hypothetical protein
VSVTVPEANICSDATSADFTVTVNSTLELVPAIEGCALSKTTGKYSRRWCSCAGTASMLALLIQPVLLILLMPVIVSSMLVLLVLLALLVIVAVLLANWHYWSC